MKGIFFVTAFFSFIFSTTYSQKIKISCIGNSITYGAYVEDREQNCYPALLQQMLGGKFEVLNFGSNGTTAMTTELSYRQCDAYQQALRSNPDIVTIKLGTNDARNPFRQFIADSFIVNYTAIIKSFQQLPSHPRIILLLPVSSYLTDSTKSTDLSIRENILPRIREIAYKEKLEIIDLHSITAEKENLFPDKLHPNAAGMSIIAERLKTAILHKSKSEQDVNQVKFPQQQLFNFYGFEGIDFDFNGHNAKIVQPKIIAAGKPWVWRARFWGHEPQTDIALLERGFHLVYCDVSELFGNDKAIAVWNNFYAMLRKKGFAKKVALEGMSRGGIYIYNWALANPKKVACIYADAPVLDLRSWPGGFKKGKRSDEEWEIFKIDYQLTEEQARIFNKMPLDNATRIAKLGFPMLHVVGDADEVVPVEENTTPFEAAVKKAGGNIKVIHKPGVHHHPHSFADPTPIVDFILAASGYK